MGISAPAVRAQLGSAVAAHPWESQPRNIGVRLTPTDCVGKAEGPQRCANGCGLLIPPYALARRKTPGYN